MPCLPLPVPIIAVPLVGAPPISGLDQCRRPVDLSGTRSRSLDEEEISMPIDRAAGDITLRWIDRHG